MWRRGCHDHDVLGEALLLFRIDDSAQWTSDKLLAACPSMQHRPPEATVYLNPLLAAQLL